MKYIQSVIMQSGETCKTYPDNIPAETLNLARQIISDALASGIFVLPNGFLVEAESHNERCLFLRVSCPSTEFRKGNPIISFAVAPHSRSGSTMWRELHRNQVSGVKLATNSTEVPPEPWCAIRLHSGADAFIEETHNILSLHGAIACAWMELVAELRTVH